VIRGNSTWLNSGDGIEAGNSSVVIANASRDNVGRGIAQQQRHQERGRRSHHLDLSGAAIGNVATGNTGLGLRLGASAAARPTSKDRSCSEARREVQRNRAIAAGPAHPTEAFPRARAPLRRHKRVAAATYLMRVRPIRVPTGKG
jgi:hypothetical protein